MIGSLRVFILAFVAMGTILVSTQGCAESTENVTRPDMETLAQLTLNLEALRNFYHADKLPERIPLIVISNHLTGTSLKLEQFGKSVVFMDKKRAQESKKAYLEFTQVEIHGDHAVIQFVYPVEGIAGTVSFNKSEQGWRVEKTSIVER